MNFSVKEDIIQLTEKWDGERFPDGRPRVSDEDLEEIRHLTLEEVWQPMFMKGYLNQFEEKLTRAFVIRKNAKKQQIYEKSAASYFYTSAKNFCFRSIISSIREM